MPKNVHKYLISHYAWHNLSCRSADPLWMSLSWGDHWQVQWFPGNYQTFQWFLRDHCKFSMVFEATITIECFLAVWPLPSMVFQWFLVLLPSLSMVFDGFGPLVKRCDGFDGSLWSTVCPLKTYKRRSLDAINLYVWACVGLALLGSKTPMEVLPAFYLYTFLFSSE